MTMIVVVLVSGQMNYNFRQCADFVDLFFVQVVSEK